MHFSTSSLSQIGLSILELGLLVLSSHFAGRVKLHGYKVQWAALKPQVKLLCAGGGDERKP